MSRLGVFPIAVLMQRRRLRNRWVDACWSACRVLPAADAVTTSTSPVDGNDGDQRYIVGGLELELFADEDDGYFENWAAPEPRVFVLWRMQNERAVPVLATVSYAEGARMLDSGEFVDGVPMPREIHAWLGDYLRMHYRPSKKRSRH